MTDDWGEHAAAWDVDRSVIAYSEKAFDSLDAVTDLDGLRILDFGCGTGLLTEKLARRAQQVVALDSSVGMITVLKDKQLKQVTALSETLSKSVIEATPSLQKPFDRVVASSVMAFVPDPVATLTLLRSLLLPGGLLVQWDWMVVEGESEFGLTESDMAAAFHDSGFEIQSISAPFSHVGRNGNAPVLMGVAIKSELASHQ